MGLNAMEAAIKQAREAMEQALGTAVRVWRKEVRGNEQGRKKAFELGYKARIYQQAARNAQKLAAKKKAKKRLELMKQAEKAFEQAAKSVAATLKQAEAKEPKVHINWEQAAQAAQALEQVQEAEARVKAEATKNPNGKKWISAVNNFAQKIEQAAVALGQARAAAKWAAKYFEHVPQVEVQVMKLGKQAAAQAKRNRAAAEQKRQQMVEAEKQANEARKKVMEMAEAQNKAKQDQAAAKQRKKQVMVLETQTAKLKTDAECLEETAAESSAFPMLQTLQILKAKEAWKQAKKMQEEAEEAGLQMVALETQATAAVAKLEAQVATERKQAEDWETQAKKLEVQATELEAQAKKLEIQATAFEEQGTTTLEVQVARLEEQATKLETLQEAETRKQGAEQRKAKETKKKGGGIWRIFTTDKQATRKKTKEMEAEWEDQAVARMAKLKATRKQLIETRDMVAWVLWEAQTKP